MKTLKTISSIIFAALAFQQLALSQTNATVVNDTNRAAVAVNSDQPVPLHSTGSNAVETAADTVTGTNADVTATETATITETTEAAAAPTSGTNPPPASLPPIVFQDVPLTTAIEALAREADINYLMDPKIGYGQPDEHGQIKAEPSVSVRWDNVTYQQALVALLDNYGLELIQDPKTKIAKVTFKPPNALPPLVTRVVQLKYASTSNMMASVQSCLTDRRSRIVPDARTSQLVVVATDPEQEAVDTLIDQLDKPTRQVLIETKLVELSSNPSTQKGIDWSGTLSAQNIAFGNGTLSKSTTTTVSSTPATTTSTSYDGGNTVITTTPAGKSVSSVDTTTTQSGDGIAGFALDTAHGLNPATGFLSADGVKAVLSFLNQSTEAQVMSTPRVVTLDNETATISVTRGYPIINITAGTANTTGGSGVTYSNIGTVLSVTPRITANDYIWLKVVPDVSSFFGTVSKTIGGQLYQADEFDTRHIETQVLIPNAHTLVMGGLVKDNPNAHYTKIPILGDIPIIGLAFRSENNSMEKDNLLIFLTPTIVKDTDFRPTKTDFLQSTPHIMKDPLDPHSWWDSAQRQGDWSNPLTPGQPFKTTVMPQN